MSDKKISELISANEVNPTDTLLVVQGNTTKKAEVGKLLKKIENIYIGDEYDSTQTYAVGDYCIHDNTLYKCTTEIVIAEEWNGVHWTAVTIEEELNRKFDKNNIVDDLNSTSETDALSAKQGKILDEKIEAIIDIIYPVGSIYISTNNTSPSILFGGTWEQIHGRFLLASGTPQANSDNYFGGVSGIQWIVVAGSTGGQDYHTLTQNEMPSHSHTSKGWAGVVDGSGTYITLGGAGGDTTYNTNYTGGSQPHNNMPPYLAVNMWKRIV